MKNLAVAAALVILGGCATMARQAFREPSVHLRDVRVVGLGVGGGQLEVHLSVYNPNSYRLDASRLNYRVFISDTVALANGMLDPRATVQAADSTIVRIPVQFSYAGLSAAARSVWLTGAVNYRVTGDVQVWTGINNITVPFSASGRYSTLRR